MKASGIVSILALGCFFLWAASTQAQYKAPSQYFPKNYPAPSTGGRTAPNSPNSPNQQQSTAQGRSKFKDLDMNTGFYFLSDTNRAYLWTKVSGSQAKNTKNGVIQTIAGETVVQK